MRELVAVLVCIVVIALAMTFVSYDGSDEHERYYNTMRSFEDPRDAYAKFVPAPALDRIITDPFNTPPLNQVLRSYDYSTMHDQLTPPWKRDDYSESVLPAYLTPIATRGYPGAFRRVGMLNDESATNDDRFKFMILVGRRKYGNGQVFQYYVTGDDVQSNIKFDLPDVSKELINGDRVYIKDLGKTYILNRDPTLDFTDHSLAQPVPVVGVPPSYFR